MAGESETRHLISAVADNGFLEGGYDMSVLLSESPETDKQAWRDVPLMCQRRSSKVRSCALKSSRVTPLFLK